MLEFCISLRVFQIQNLNKEKKYQLLQKLVLIRTGPV